MSVYRGGTIKRERRSNSRLAKLDEQIIAEVRADHPQSVRHVFYRMTNPRLAEPVEKSERGYRHVQDRVVKLRRGGRIPYDWITDATRRGYFTNTYAGAGDFIQRMAGLYRADLWALSDFYCEVWCESRSIAGAIQGTCRDLAVSLYPAGGFSSLTLAYQSAEYMLSAADGKPIVVFYVGDYDPAGVLIDQAIERELRAHLPNDIDMDFQRIAITEQQIEDHDLPTKPRKAGDRRAQHIAATVEAEAMPAHVMCELLRTKVEELLPEGALRGAKVAEDSEREGLRALAASLKHGRSIE